MGRGSKESRSLQSQARAGGGFAAVDSRKLHMLRGRVIMLRRQRSPAPRAGASRRDGARYGEFYGSYV